MQNRNGPRILKTCFAALAFFAGVSAHAALTLESEASFADADSLLSKIEYITPTSWRTSSDEVAVKTVTRLGFTDVTAFYGTFPAQAHFAHILASSDLNRFVTVRYDYALKDSTLLGRVIRLPEDQFLVNTKTRAGRPVTLFFNGFSQRDINPVLLAFQQSKTSRTSSVTMLTELLVPKSCAADPTASQIAKSMIEHPGAYAADLATLTNVGVMVSIRSCAAPIMSTIHDLLGLHFDWRMLNPFYSPTAKIFNLARMMYELGRTVVSTMVGVITKVVREGRMHFHTAISLACSIAVNSVLKPLKILVKSQFEKLEIGSQIAGRSLSLGANERVDQLLNSVKEAQWTIFEAKVKMFEAFERIPGARQMEALNSSRAVETFQNEARGAVNANRALSRTNSVR